MNKNSNLLKTKRLSITFELRITMQILTRLLVTKIVASNLSTSESSPKIILSRVSGFSRICCNWLGESEKNATSEPDTNADTNNSNIITANIATICGVKPKYVIANSSNRLGF